MVACSPSLPACFPSLSCLCCQAQSSLSVPCVPELPQHRCQFEIRHRSNYFGAGYVYGALWPPSAFSLLVALHFQLRRLGDCHTLPRHLWKCHRTASSFEQGCTHGWLVLPNDVCNDSHLWRYHPTTGSSHLTAWRRPHSAQIATPCLEPKNATRMHIYICIQIYARATKHMYTHTYDTAHEEPAQVLVLNGTTRL